MRSSLLENVQSSGPIKHLAMTLWDPHRSGQMYERTLSLSTLQGRLIVLFVLGIDCGTCKHLAGILSSLLPKYSEVDVFGVCVRAGCREKLADFAKGADVQFPLGYCPTRELCPALGIPMSRWLFYPTLIFVDQQQRLRAVFVGKHDFFRDPAVHIRAVLDQLLEEESQTKGRAEVTA